MRKILQIKKYFHISKMSFCRKTLKSIRYHFVLVDATEVLQLPRVYSTFCVLNLIRCAVLNSRWRSFPYTRKMVESQLMTTQLAVP